MVSRKAYEEGAPNLTYLLMQPFDTTCWMRLKRQRDGEDAGIPMYTSQAHLPVPLSRRSSVGYLRHQHLQRVIPEGGVR
jgi:hypothetical protein